MKSIAALLSFVMTFTSAFAYAGKAPLCPADTQLTRYMWSGKASDLPPHKIYNFVKLRSDIIEHIDDADRARCLNDSYRAALDEEAAFWAKKVSEAKCTMDEQGNVEDSCSIAQEVRDSNKFINNLENDTNDDIQKAVALSKEIADLRDQQAAEGDDPNPASGGAPACSNRPATNTELFGDARTVMCCGAKGNNDGVVRSTDASISYEECLGKVSPSKHGFGDGLASCAGNIVKGAFDAIIGAIKSLWHLPGMIGQILSLIRHPSTILTLGEKIKQFVVDKYHAVFSCYNGYEQVQEGCKMIGQVLTAIVAPEAIGALIGVLMKPIGVASRALELALESTAGGRKVLGAAKKAAGATGKVVGGAVKVTKKVASKAPKFVKKPVGWIANRIKALEAKRAALSKRMLGRMGRTKEVKWLGNRLSKASEAVAARASQNGLYRRALLKYYRADRASRARAGLEVGRMAESPAVRAAPAPTADGADKMLSTFRRTSGAAPATTDTPAFTLSGKGSVTPPRIPSEPFVKGPTVEGPSGSMTMTGQPAVAPLRAAPSSVTFDTGAPVARSATTVVPRASLTPEVAASMTKVEKFTADIQELGNSRAGAQRVYGTTSTRSVVYRTKGLHTEVDRLEAAGAITRDQAKGYHDTISFGEAEATGKPRVREWKSPEPTTPPPVADAAPVSAPASTAASTTESIGAMKQLDALPTGATQVEYQNFFGSKDPAQIKARADALVKEISAREKAGEITPLESSRARMRVRAAQEGASKGLPAAAEPVVAPQPEAAAPAPTVDGASGATVSDDAAEFAPVAEPAPIASVEDNIIRSNTGDSRISTLSAETPKAWDAKPWQRQGAAAEKSARSYFKGNQDNLRVMVDRNDPKLDYYKQLGYKFKPGKKGRVEVDIPSIQTQATNINGRIDELVASGKVKEADVLRPAALYVKTPLAARVPIVGRFIRKDYVAIDLGAEIPKGYKPVKDISYEDRIDAMASGKYLITTGSAPSDLGRVSSMISNPDSMGALRSGAARMSTTDMTKAQRMRFQYVEDMHEYLAPTQAARFDRWLAQNKVNLGTRALTVDQVRENIARLSVTDMQTMIRDLRDKPFMSRLGQTINDPLEFEAVADVAWYQNNVPTLRRAYKKLTLRAPDKVYREKAAQLNNSATGAITRAIDEGVLGKPKFMESKKDFEARVRDTLSRALTAVHDSRDLTPMSIMEQALAPKVDPKGSLYIYACWSGLWTKDSAYYKSMCRN